MLCASGWCSWSSWMAMVCIPKTHFLCRYADCAFYLQDVHNQLHNHPAPRDHRLLGLARHTLKLQISLSITTRIDSGKRKTRKSRPHQRTQTLLLLPPQKDLLRLETLGPRHLGHFLLERMSKRLYSTLLTLAQESEEIFEVKIE